MDVEQSSIEALVTAPRETRDVEVKSWVDPRTAEGKANIIRTLFALRNFNGGRLLIGFDDGTLKPDPLQPADLLDAYHGDDIQALVSKYASSAFDVHVRLGVRDKQRHPVLLIDSGVKTPVALKTDLYDSAGKVIARRGTVYYRTLNANGTVSSSEILPADWPEFMEICMDNREADIARFVRRHLAGLDLGGLAKVLSTAHKPQTSLEDETRAWMDVGHTTSEAIIQQRQPSLDPDSKQSVGFLQVGSWEVALTIRPAPEGLIADQAFYDRVAASIPQHSAWPVWVGTRTAHEKSVRPVQSNNGWQVLIIGKFVVWSHAEFQRWEPGRFYLRRLLDEDAAAEANGAMLGQYLDPCRNASRVAEAIIAGLSIGRALGCAEDSTELGFAFRWSGLKGRVLGFGLSGLTYLPSDQPCHDQGETSFVNVPLTTSPSSVASFVHAATRSLFAKFDGFSMSHAIVERCIAKLLARET